VYLVVDTRLIVNFPSGGLVLSGSFRLLGAFFPLACFNIVTTVGISFCQFLFDFGCILFCTPALFLCKTALMLLGWTLPLHLRLAFFVAFYVSM
jgi:hypothetical protein